MYSHINPKNHQPAPLVAQDVYEVIMKVFVSTALPVQSHATNKLSLHAESFDPILQSRLNYVLLCVVKI